MKKLYPLTYLNFSEELQHFKKNTDIEEVAGVFKHIKRFEKNLLFLKGLTFFVLDYTKRNYLVMTGPVKEITGFHVKDWLEGGIDFVIDIYQKDDFKTWNTQIFPSTYTFLKQLSPEEESNYVFEFNYRLQSKNGKIFSILQRGSYVTDPASRLPLYAYGMALNITPAKNDTKMLRIISKYNAGNDENTCQHISTDYYYPNPDDALLTKRETEILKWMADGLSSKQLADKFRLSHNTIMNHRKNMLRKANAKNVAELIKFAIEHRMI